MSVYKLYCIDIDYNNIINHYYDSSYAGHKRRQLHFESVLHLCSQNRNILLHCSTVIDRHNAWTPISTPASALSSLYTVKIRRKYQSKTKNAHFCPDVQHFYPSRESFFSSGQRIIRSSEIRLKESKIHANTPKKLLGFHFSVRMANYPV